MALHDDWARSVEQDEQGNALRAGVSKDAAPVSCSGQSAPQDAQVGRTGRGTARFLYPVVVIAGVLLLIILAAV